MVQRLGAPVESVLDVRNTVGDGVPAKVLIRTPQTGGAVLLQPGVAGPLIVLYKG